MERLNRTDSRLHRIGDHYGHLIDSDHFMGRDPFEGSWMSMHKKPAANIIKDNKGFDIEIVLPGFKREEITIHIKGDILEVIAEQPEHQYKNAQPYYIRREYAAPALARTFRIPDEVKDDQIFAVYEKGILKIRLPHKDEENNQTAPKKIEVE